jgi:endonuclease G
MRFPVLKQYALGVAASVLFVVGNLVWAGSSDFAQCRQLFPNQTPPPIHFQQEMKPRALCFDGYAVLHSGVSHTPIYVVEKLNRSVLEPEVDRTDRFYEEARLPHAERADLNDYQGSGYDRGHMAPAADMGTNQAMAQSFSLANMVPQAPQNNRKTWAKLEKDTRKYVMRAEGDVYVISGPVYDARPSTIGRNRVWVPQHLFKLVYDPNSHRAWAHWIDNTDDAKAGRPISYDELVRRTGVEFLPTTM